MDGYTIAVMCGMSVLSFVVGFFIAAALGGSKGDAAQQAQDDAAQADSLRDHAERRAKG